MKKLLARACVRAGARKRKMMQDAGGDDLPCARICIRLPVSAQVCICWVVLWPKPSTTKLVGWEGRKERG